MRIMNSANQIVPSLRQRLCKRWHGLAWWEQSIVGTMAVLGLMVFVVFYQFFGWLPGPSVSGVVVDKATGQPVANAHVVVNVKVTGFGLVHSVTGCSGGSGLVMTDAQGRFAYSVAGRDAFGWINPLHGFIDVGVYHPDYSLPTPRADLVQFPEAWSVRASRREQRIELVPKATSAAQRYVEIDGSFGSGCIGVSRIHSPAALSRAIYVERWELICGPRSDPAAFDYVVLEQALRGLESSLAGVARTLSRTGHKQHAESGRREYIWKKVLQDYPRPSSAPGFGRPLTVHERAAVCDLYAPPIEQVITEERPQ